MIVVFLAKALLTLMVTFLVTATLGSSHQKFSDSVSTMIGWSMVVQGGLFAILSVLLIWSL